MAVSIIGSVATLAGITVVFSTVGYLGYWAWKNNKQTGSLKSIEKMIGGMLGENGEDNPEESNSQYKAGQDKILRPWVCIHCGTANPAIENTCEQCGRESQS
ncbi:MAG: hypothetical protein MJE63_13165 [Proteobacteria bacterium]|nr:hypothetical protein [Pseudomonadota bacterium]